MREVFFVNVSSPANASLTARDVGNAFAIAGSRSATAVPFTTSAWNFPRSSLAKSERLYVVRAIILRKHRVLPLSKKLCTKCCAVNSNGFQLFHQKHQMVYSYRNRFTTTIGRLVRLPIVIILPKLLLSTFAGLFSENVLQHRSVSTALFPKL